jgi:hypothetical protein
MTQFTAIYGLFDSRTPDVIMYVGKGLAGRAAKHWKNFLKHDNAVSGRLTRWLRELRSAGVEPAWRFLEENVSADAWQDRERFWIAYWRERNSNLCNVTDGGTAWPISAVALAGSINVKSGHISRLGRIQGRKNAESGHMRRIQKLGCSAAGRIGGKIGGKISGPHTVRIMHQKTTREQRVKAARAAGRVSGRKNVESGHWQRVSTRGLHVRHHKNRGTSSTACKLCRTAFEASRTNYDFDFVTFLPFIEEETRLKSAA